MRSSEWQETILLSIGVDFQRISLWMERAGQHSERLHERLFFQAIKAGHVQLDELYTRVKSVAGTVLAWSAITAKTKLIFALHIGGQAIEDACLLFHQIRLRLVEGCKPVFTSDGRNQYFHGMTAHYGYWDKPPRARVFHWFPAEDLPYDQIRKERRGRKVKFLYSIIRLGTRTVIRKMLLGLGYSGLIQTSFAERAYLTLRELIAPLSRRTWSIAYDLYHLKLHIQWGLAYYHLSRVHQSLRVRVRGPSKYRHRTPAMAAGLTKRRWSVAEILLMHVPDEVWLKPFPAA